jgi:hypothetical protein
MSYNSLKVKLLKATPDADIYDYLENDEIVKKGESEIKVFDCKRKTRMVILFLIFVDLVTLVLLFFSFGTIFKQNKC